MFGRTRDGSTGRLLQLCLGYFLFYVITGLTVKYFLGSPEEGLPGFNGIEYLLYSTIGGNAIALAVVLALRWYKLDSFSSVRIGPWEIPAEILYIVPSGVCTAVVIPTTTLMYTLPISVMVAMVIMRGSIIVVSRIIDSIQIRQGILDKKVYVEENIGVVFAILAVAAKVLWAPSTGGKGFDFLQSRAAVSILLSYISAYGIRLYIMNYYKNTQAKRGKHNNKAFFGIEQMSASVTMILAALILFHSPSLFGWEPEQITMYRDAVLQAPAQWPWAILAGTAFGIVAFFSVFLFMFRGRTATFVGLVNRLTSLIAGTVSTLIFWAFFTGKFPTKEDWASLLFIFIAVGFLSRAEQKRAAELAARHEIEGT